MRIVFLSMHSLHEIKSGGAVCVNRNYELLCKICGAENLFYITISDSDMSSGSNYHRYPRESKSVKGYLQCLSGRDGYTRETEKSVIEDIISIQPDIVFCGNSRLGGILEKIPANIKVALFMENVEKEYMWGIVRHANPFGLIRYFEVYHNERLALKRADLVMCLNERDARKVKEIYGRDADLLVPINFPDVFDAQEMERRSARKGQLLFVGSSFLPNIHGISWFIENVLPRVDAELLLVGKDLEKHKDKFDRPNVSVIGTVEATAPYYYASDAVVLPIFMGSGMKVKTAEALMYGKILFATNEALEGYPDAPDVCSCNTADEFVTSINRYMKDEKRAMFSEANRRYFLEHLETGQIEDRFFAALRGLMTLDTKESGG